MSGIHCGFGIKVQDGGRRVERGWIRQIGCVMASKSMLTGANADLTDVVSFVAEKVAIEVLLQCMCAVNVFEYNFRI